MVMAVGPPHRVCISHCRPSNSPRDLRADAIGEVFQVHTYYEPDIERHFLSDSIMLTTRVSAMFRRDLDLHLL